jgi:hypothetical protein
VTAVLIAGVSACGSSGGDVGGTGLISGTVVNDLARDMSPGLDEKTAKSGLNGSPLRQLRRRGAECDIYRGVDQSVSNLDIKATGRMWVICFVDGVVFSAKSTCPNPWTGGEFQRYKDAGYSADPTDCSS